VRQAWLLAHLAFNFDNLFIPMALRQRSFMGWPIVFGHEANLGDVLWLKPGLKL
jgi:hypothetical protein